MVLESRINVQVRAGGVYSAGELDQIVGDQPLSVRHTPIIQILMRKTY